MIYMKIKQDDEINVISNRTYHSHLLTPWTGPGAWKSWRVTVSAQIPGDYLQATGAA